jgi:hypothetical protein
MGNTKKYNVLPGRGKKVIRKCSAGINANCDHPTAGPSAGYLNPRVSRSLYDLIATKA